MGRPSSAILSFPDEPLILKFRAFFSTSFGRSEGLIMSRKVRLGSKLETTTGARYSVPSFNATPVTLPFLTIISSTLASQMISPPKD